MLGTPLSVGCAEQFGRVARALLLALPPRA